MRDHFKIEGPTCISFSGGRTSAYMLWRVLQSNGGLPADAAVCFANTGREEEATLEFVRDCAKHWGTTIHWVEWEHGGYKEVDFATAARDGEPFEALIQQRRFLPNPVTRFCTSELKIRTMHRWLRANWQALGWDAEDLEWNQMIGIRADEARRVAKIRARGHSTETTKETMLVPLADAGVTLPDVHAFWQAQPFGLGLQTNAAGRTTAGNCDLCFLKPAAQVASLIHEKPTRGVWWAKMEKYAEDNFVTRNNGGSFRFRSDRPSYAAMLENNAAQTTLFRDDEEALACFCGE